MTSFSLDESFTYEAFYDRIASMTDGIGTSSFFYYPDDGLTNGAGNLARVDGPFVDDTLKYTYDALGRLKKREIVDDATYTTDSVGRVIGRSIDGSASQTEYDSLGRVESQTNVLGRFDYTYVGDSQNLSTVDYPNPA